ncbi:type II secretion system F family protein [Thalassotalea sp. 1_MG-2023]|uniref:type II secretion system F family protein n=1 Tax=Thalassotalea sp. 1_MG-2023 TaxID=3062680 RepID=UPI0026E34911|nr:type II secretion system F family protein [Thalassotalea sp. 1_MG-2023]MDO6426294.1 type II secretion system F family protein [Thalassotalea sp. 1_MG-2023]
MAAFDYIGRNSSGTQVKGSIEATNAAAVAEQLNRQHIIPIAIEPSKDKSGDANNQLDLAQIFGSSPVSLDDLIVFCRQMYALVRSGVPILRAINGMADSSNNKQLKKALVEIASQLEGGYALSSALNHHPRIFTPLFISLVHVGENTGQLEQAFAKLASYFEREQETRKRIKTALRYPSFVIIAIVIAIVILNIFVIPTFADMFSKLGAELPWATKALINSSAFFLSYWPHMLIVCVFGFFGTRSYLKTTDGKYRWDRIKTRLPIVGSIIERSILARFSHSFAIVLKAGVPMTTGLSLVSEAVDNSYMGKKIVAMRTAIESGESLLRSAIASELFTPLVLQMVAVGEETGRVDELLQEVAEYYEREVDYELSTLTAKIEPILIAVVAAMVLILALGIFTPMWDMMSAFKG